MKTGKTLRMDTGDFACHEAMLGRVETVIRNLISATESLMEESQDHVNGRDILSCVKAIKEAEEEWIDVRDRRWFEAVEEDITE